TTAGPGTDCRRHRAYLVVCPAGTRRWSGRAVGAHYSGGPEQLVDETVAEPPVVACGARPSPGTVRHPEPICMAGSRGAGRTIGRAGEDVDADTALRSSGGRSRPGARPLQRPRLSGGKY